MSKLSERGERLLLQALKQSNIDEPNETNQSPGFLTKESVYWQRVGDDIEIVFNSAHWFTGRLKCSITLRSFVDSTLRHFPDDADAVLTLVEVLAYLQGNLSALTLETSRGIFLRSDNLNSRNTLKKELAEIQLELVESMLAPLMIEAITRFTEMNKRLRAEPRRGGSKARLKEGERRSLHTQYDGLHKIAKAAKKDYNVTLKRFAKSRKAQGYSHREWLDHWRKHLAKNYPDELAKDFLELFARRDSPSASEVAYVRLSKHTGHKRSYLPRLVTASRSAPKKKDNQAN